MSSSPDTNVEKVFFLLKKNPALSMPEFSEYWLNRHGPLLSATTSYSKYRSRYIQNHLVGSSPRGEDTFPFDGITQVWVNPTSVDLPSFASTEAYKSTIRPDEEKLLDRKSSIVLRTAEHVIVPGTAACKVMILPRRRQGMTPQEFSAFWRGQHADVVLAQQDFVRYLRGYKQNHVVQGSCTYMTGEPVPEGIAFDGVIEMWFDSPEQARLAFQTDGYRVTVLDDARGAFVIGRGNGGVGCFVREHDIPLN